VSKHRIILEVEMTDHGKQPLQKTLAAIAEGMVRNATEDYGIRGYEDGVPVGDGGYDGPFVTAAWTTRPGRMPEELAAGVKWWLEGSPSHSEDVVAMTDDNQDALILSGLNDVMSVVWVDPEGRVRTLKGQWETVHLEEDEEEE
jgi:hypothetical protein